jgi:hypothetical protein
MKSGCNMNSGPGAWIWRELSALILRLAALQLADFSLLAVQRDSILKLPFLNAGANKPDSTTLGDGYKQPTPHIAGTN